MKTGGLVFRPPVNLPSDLPYRLTFFRSVRHLDAENSKGTKKIMLYWGGKHFCLRDKSLFCGIYNYFQTLKIYNQTLKIYFQYIQLPKFCCFLRKELWKSILCWQLSITGLQTVLTLLLPELGIWPSDCSMTICIYSFQNLPLQ